LNTKELQGLSLVYGTELFPSQSDGNKLSQSKTSSQTVS